MFKSRSFRRRSSKSIAKAHVPVELLEDKRLLTSTIDGSDETGGAAIPVEVQGAATAIISDRTEVTFELRLNVPARSPADPLTFAEIRIVGQEVWLLSELREPVPSEVELPSSFEASDSVTAAIPDLPVKHFRIGSDEGGLPLGVEVTTIANRDEFYSLIGDSQTELLYSRLDPELKKWREQVESQIIQQADDLYGELFGAETESPIYYYRGLLAVEDVAVAFAAAGNRDATNVQVDGVDEGDIVETDGAYIYTISGNEIVIVKAADVDSDAEVVSRIELSQSPVAMFLANDRLTVISRDYGNLAWPSAAIHSAPASARTVVTVLNVADRSAPELSQETIIDGQYQSSRAIGDQVYIVVANNEGIPYVPELYTVYDETLESNYRFETREEYLTRVDQLVNGGKYQKGLTPPSVYRRGDDASDQLALERLGWLNGAGNASPDGGQLASVLQFDTTSNDSTPVSNIGVNTRRYGATQIYASPTALYLVTEEYAYANTNPGGIAIDFVLPQPSTVESRIHKIGLSTGQLVLEGEGVVPGNVESQFSIDEHDGYLRVATTTGQNWWWTDQSSQNHLFVLEDTGDTLDIVGSVRDLAAGERIYSARFDGARAWMVTFRQTDPVFSFDLSDPTNPHVTGELKIPGYSDYLQLIDENHLLAIGRNATDEGRIQEVQVSLFDVSDMAAPTLLHRYSMDSEVWGDSAALQDHLAFNYLPESQILAVPFGAWAQQGMVLLHVDVTDGIEVIGQIDAEVAIGLTYTGFRWSQENSYKRSVQINDSLYAVSTAFISVVDLNDPDTVLQTLNLQNNQTPPSPVPELPIETGRLEEILRVTEILGETLDPIDFRLELEEMPGIELPNPEEIEEYEFRLLDRESGLEILRRKADTPDISLVDALGSLPEPGTYDAQFRTKSNRLQNPKFGSWSAPAALSVRSEAAQMISESVLRFGQRLLQWSRVSDRVTTTGVVTEVVTNPVGSYDVWISDASTNQRVLLERGANAPRLSLDLPAGSYFAWFRAVYEDGSTGGWSLRERLQILGQKLTDLIGPGITANTSPSITLPELVGATSFEVEVTAPDGTIMNYEVTDLSQSKLEITDSLSSGLYSFRARATLASGVPTEWSDPIEFSVFGRPSVGVNGRRLSFGTAAATTVEVWINKAGTQERVFHDTDFQTSTIEDAISELGLDADHLSGYDVWTRFTMEDGSRTPWSEKANLNRQVSEIVDVDLISAFAVGESQVISWNQGFGIESYEVWVSKVGESGAFRRIADLTTTFVAFEDQLPEGRFNAWVRGKLASGGYTSWGTSRGFSVENRPTLSIVDQIASWTLAGDTDPNAKYEIWVNKLADNISPGKSKALHETDLSSASFDLSTLSSGEYRGWVRKISEVGGTTVRSVWSDRVSFTIPVETVLSAAFDDVADVVLSALDGI